MTEPEVARFAAMLADQHRHVLDLAGHVLTTPEPERRAAYRRFVRYLAAHEAAEQLAMHPRFLAWERDDDSVLARLREEAAVAEAVDHLSRVGDLDGERFAVAFRGLIELVSTHLRREEREELPGYLHRLSDDDAEELMAALGQVGTVVSAQHDPVPPVPFQDVVEQYAFELDRLISQHPRR